MKAMICLQILILKHLRSRRIEEFRRRLNEECTLLEDDFVRKVMIDCAFKVENITFSLPEELEKLEPFGKGNEKPVFAISKARVSRINIVGKNKNVVKLRLRDDTGMHVEGVIFNKTEEVTDYIIGKFGEEQINKAYLGKENDIYLSCIFYPDINEYNGIKNIQIIINNYC